jgi:inhibitor of cysteine peptidase
VKKVDEADFLKTDGTFIYTISNRLLSIILAYPSNQAKVLSTIDLNDFNCTALFI